MTADEQYIGFAKKYRPKRFSDLIGQDVLVKVLSYSIINNRLAGGYLLTGIRGIGKTTSARIIAKTVNCNQSLKDDKNISPCEQCKNCLAFNNNTHPDILEIDAASKTGVDDVRIIIESSEYKPLLGQYKIFIIDEVHMLSKSAFNALLKVLEEPPKHLIFIFATTETQKLPDTVISRCQKFDLKRLSLEELTELLKNITCAENLQIDDSAVNMIAMHSEGSARDAISLLDQAASACEGEKITKDIVNKILGAIDLGIIIRLLENIIDNDLQEALKSVNKIYTAGANIELFITSIAELIAHLSKTCLIADYPADEYEIYNDSLKIILEKTNITILSILWQIFSMGLKDIKSAHNELIAFEMLIIKAIYASNIEEIKINSAQNNKETANDDYALDFLKYLSDSNEMNMYYSLMNELEIKNFTDQKFEAAGNVDLKYKSNIQEALLKWSGKQYEVAILKQDNVLSLKDKLISDIKKSSEWQKINRFFPLANISDILSSK